MARHATPRSPFAGFVATLLAGSLVLAGCTGGAGSDDTGSGAPDGTTDAAPLAIDYTESPAIAAARLAAGIEAADSLDALKPLAQEALARAGMATVDAEGAAIAPVGSRDIGMPLTPGQVDTLALDHLDGQGWTLATLTQAVAEHPEGPGEALLDKPTTLGRLLRAWAELAAETPDDPEAFAPLLLAELARARGGAADYTTGPIQPASVVFSYLELVVLTGGARAGSITTGAGASGAAHTSARIRAPALLPSDDKGPCAALEAAFGKEAQDFLEEGSGGIFDKAVDRVRDWLTGKGADDLAKGIGTAGNVLRIANLLTTMMAMYGGYSLTLTWDPATPHYLGYDGGHGDVTATVTANVSTRPQADAATMACLKFLGVEKPDDDSVKDTTVAWVPLRGTPKHATVKSKELTRMAVSEDGKAVLELAMTAEKSTEAGKTGKVKKDQIVIQAELTTYKATPSKIAAASVFGGTLGGSVEAGKGWFNSWFPKKAVATIPVEWHQLPVWRGVVDRPDGTRWVFQSGQGAKSIWTATLEGGSIQAGPTTFKVSGKASFDLTSGSTEATLMREGKATMGGVGITMTTLLPMSIELTGSDDAPTLTIDSKSGSTVVSAMGQAVSKRVEPGGTTTVVLTEVEEK